MLFVRSRRSPLHFGPPFSRSSAGNTTCYPQFRHELSRISLRKLSRRQCLPRSQRLFEVEKKPHEVPRLDARALIVDLPFTSELFREKRYQAPAHENEFSVAGFLVRADDGLEGAGATL
jgi:hypothetical protein